MPIGTSGLLALAIVAQVSGTQGPDPDRVACALGGSIGTARASGGFDGFVPDAPQLTIHSEIDASGPSYTLVFGCTFRRRVAVEWVLPFLGPDHRASLQNLGTVISFAESNAQVPLMGRAAVFILRGRIAPYVSAGAGVLPNIDFDRFNPLVAVGGGVQLEVTRHVLVRLEGTHYRAQFNDHLIGSADGVLVDISYRDSLRFNDLGVSVLFRK